MFKGFCCFPVSRHFPYSRDFGVSLFSDTLTFQKCWKQEKQPNPLRKSLLSRDFVISPVYRHFLDSKVSRNRKTTKLLEKIHKIQGIFLFLDTFDYKKKCRKHEKQQYRLKKKACSRYYGVSPVSRHLFITKNVKKHEKLQSPLNK